MTDLFQVFEPAPPRCRAVQVTVDNIAEIAQYLKDQGMYCTVIYEWGHQASLHVQRRAYTPPGSDTEIPGVDLIVQTGEMLVQLVTEQEPLVLAEGWNVLSENDSWPFLRQWRQV